MGKKVIYGVFLIVLGACSSQKSGNSIDDSDNQSEIKSNKSENLACQNNTTDEYKLCQYHEMEDNVKYTSFKVYNIASDELVFEQSKVRKVSWDSDFEIRIDNYTRISAGENNEDYYLYDVKKKTKVSKNKL